MTQYDNPDGFREYAKMSRSQYGLEGAIERSYFLKTKRLVFSQWSPEDLPLAESLWGDPGVSKYICAGGIFRQEDIENRLQKELDNGDRFGIQYWPVFERASGALVGCCGLRPSGEQQYELGFHLRSQFWGLGLATEAATAVIAYAFDVLQADSLFAGHHPHNTASAKVLRKLGFSYVAEEFYAPTGLMHPSYLLKTNGRNRNDPERNDLPPQILPQLYRSAGGRGND